MDNFIAILNINEYEGGIPSGYDLVVYEGFSEGDPDEDREERAEETGAVLYGFDEVGQFAHTYIQPEYGFLRY